MVDRIKEKHVVGIKQATKAINNNTCIKLYVAKDVDSKLLNPLVTKAKDKDIEIIYVENMKELGKLCGIEVGASAAAILLK